MQQGDGRRRRTDSRELAKTSFLRSELVLEDYRRSLRIHCLWFESLRGAYIGQVSEGIDRFSNRVSTSNDFSHPKESVREILVRSRFIHVLNTERVNEHSIWDRSSYAISWITYCWVDASRRLRRRIHNPFKGLQLIVDQERDANLRMFFCKDKAEFYCDLGKIMQL